ncbi:MAG: hypothetical protein QXD25_01840 [Nanopusillaceae archaeon]
MSCLIELSRHFDITSSLEEILKKEIKKNEKNTKVKTSIYIRIKAFDVLLNNYKELKINYLDYIILKSSGYITLKDTQTESNKKRYLIICSENRYIIHISNDKEEIKKYCESIFK